MGEVIAFRPLRDEARAGRARGARGGGEILLFTGVRRERAPYMPAAAPRGGRGRPPREAVGRGAGDEAGAQI